MVGKMSFRHRIFLALLLLGLLPTALSIGVGALLVGQLGSSVGTLGPWEAVAASGQELIDAATAAAPADTALASLAEAHRETLSASLRNSRAISFMNERFLAVLPALALAAVAFLGVLSFFVARALSAGFSRPIAELVGWTETIARSRPLPPPTHAGEAGPAEFRKLRYSFRTMASQLETARQRELDSVRLKTWTEMARRIAHDIKNPLTPMRLAAGTLARGAQGAQAETAAIMLEEIDRLDEMARSLSQWGRAPEGPPSEIDMMELAEELSSQHAEVEGRIRVVVDGVLPLLIGHHNLVSRALRNLLVNAVEAAELRNGVAEDGQPDVKVLLDVQDGNLRVRVRDRGPGIPEEILDRIWMPDVTTKKHGTGLGLAIVKQAADFHGGKVTAVNLGEPWGAELTMELPLKPLPEPGRTGRT